MATARPVMTGNVIHCIDFWRCSQDESMTADREKQESPGAINNQSALLHLFEQIQKQALAAARLRSGNFNAAAKQEP